MEYIYDSFDEALPGSFYNGKAMLYIMDARSERLVLKPKGMGERIAGHLNLQDFYRANNIMEPQLQAEVEASVASGASWPTQLFQTSNRGSHWETLWS